MGITRRDFFKFSIFGGSAALVTLATIGSFFSKSELEAREEYIKSKGHYSKLKEKYDRVFERYDKVSDEKELLLIYSLMKEIILDLDKSIARTYHDEKKQNLDYLPRTNLNKKIREMTIEYFNWIIEIYKKIPEFKKLGYIK